MEIISIVFVAIIITIILYLVGRTALGWDGEPPFLVCFLFGISMTLVSFIVIFLIGSLSYFIVQGLK